MTTTNQEKKAIRKVLKKKALSVAKKKAPTERETPVKQEEITPLESVTSAKDIRSLPNTIVGAGFKIVNANSLASTALVVEDHMVMRQLYNYNSDLFPYYNVSAFQARGKGKYTVEFPIGLFTNVTNVTDDLKMNNPELATMLAALVTVRMQLIAKMIEDDAPIPFYFLAEVLSSVRGKFISIRAQGLDLFARIESVVTQNSIFSGTRVQVTFDSYVWNSGKLVKKTNKLYIPADAADRKLNAWGFVSKPSEEALERYLARGRRVIALNSACSYVNMLGNMTVGQGWFARAVDARGRGVVDKQGHALFRPNEHEHVNFEDEREGAILEITDVTEDVIRSIEPVMTVFSFNAKKWGFIDVDQLTDINFRDDAFAQLVMDETDKNLVHTLVKNNDASVTSDLIDGKGGGCVLLLHGEPGLGKTLTAEAVAETLRRPLYAVSAGELGTEPEALEQRLQVVLSTAARWNAVLLLDEADVFLESRKSGDIHRNAMVGTFLRLLEYYNGVLILTTNRVKDMDKAFYSRVSLALRYETFDLAKRIQVITNLLRVNKVDLPADQIAEVAATNVNGRQIKNSIRIARYLAKEQARAVTSKDILEVLNKLLSFEETFDK